MDKMFLSSCSLRNDSFFPGASALLLYTLQTQFSFCDFKIHSACIIASGMQKKKKKENMKLMNMKLIKSWALHASISNYFRLYFNNSPFYWFRTTASENKSLIRRKLGELAFLKRKPFIFIFKDFPLKMNQTILISVIFYFTL